MPKRSPPSLPRRASRPTRRPPGAAPGSTAAGPSRRRPPRETTSKAWIWAVPLGGDYKNEESFLVELQRVLDTWSYHNGDEVVNKLLVVWQRIHNKPACVQRFFHFISKFTAQVYFLGVQRDESLPCYNPQCAKNDFNHCFIMCENDARYVLIF